MIKFRHIKFIDLIKRVAKKLKQELPDLNQFLTLSPIPGLMTWLEKNAPLTHEQCIDGSCTDEDFLKQAVTYLTESTREDGLPNDPVGRFHLGNGAILDRINLNADKSISYIDSLKDYINKKMNISVVIADDPLSCVALGTGKVLDDLDSYIDKIAFN